MLGAQAAGTRRATLTVSVQRADMTGPRRQNEAGRAGAGGEVIAVPLASGAHKRCEAPVGAAGAGWVGAGLGSARGEIAVVTGSTVRAACARAADGGWRKGGVGAGLGVAFPEGSLVRCALRFCERLTCNFCRMDPHMLPGQRPTRRIMCSHLTCAICRCRPWTPGAEARGASCTRVVDIVWCTPIRVAALGTSCAVDPTGAWLAGRICKQGGRRAACQGPEDMKMLTEPFGTRPSCHSRQRSCAEHDAVG